jgi:hypothetical protein
VSEPTEPRIIADTGGLLVTDDGRRVLVIDRRTGALTTVAFVLGVIALVVGGFGAVGFATDVPASVAAVFLAIGLLVAGATFAVVRTIRRRRRQPLGQCRPVGVIDRKLGLFSYRGGALIQLDQVRFARKMQIGSSSPKLVAVTPGGTLVLKRGNPFDGGIGDVAEILTAAVAGQAEHRPI